MTGTSGGDNTPVAIQITDGSSVLIASGVSKTLTAVATAKDGHQIAGAVIAWSSSDPTVVAANSSTITAIKVGSATVTASSGSVSASIAVSVTPGQVSQLVIRTQPAGGVVGAVLRTQPVLEFRDAAGNLVTSSSGFVSAAIASGGGSLAGTTTVQAVGGVVSFTNLEVIGATGPRTLAFAAGVLAATSSSFSVDAPPTPFMVADSSAVSFSLQGIGDSASRAITIVNTGSQPLSGMSTAITYDAGGAIGWLSARLSSPNAPTVLTLVANGGALAAGTYHATVQVTGPGATNSPLAIGVTLAVAPQFTFSYGSATEKIKVLDVGASFAPTISVVDGSGAPVKNVPLTFASRASSVATVGSDGRITAVAGGDAWIVANTPSSSDSVFVVVPRSASAPVLLTDATNSTAKLGDTLLVHVIFDARTTQVGAASLAVELVGLSGSLTYVYNVPTGNPAPVVNASNFGVVRISLGAATGFSGPVQVLTMKIYARTANSTGWLNLYVLDASAVDGTSLTAQSSSTRIPVIIR